MLTTLNWFEIPAIDFERAKTFYAKVLNVPIHDDTNRTYAYLPADPQKADMVEQLVLAKTLFLR